MILLYFLDLDGVDLRRFRLVNSLFKAVFFHEIITHYSPDQSMLNEAKTIKTFAVNIAKKRTKLDRRRDTRP